MNRKVLLFGLGGLAAAVVVVAFARAGCGPQAEACPAGPPPQGRIHYPPSLVPPAQKAEDIEALIKRLESIPAQKAELEQAEKEAVARLKEKLEQQRQRLRKLGVTPDEPAPAAATPS